MTKKDTSTNTEKKKRGRPPKAQNKAPKEEKIKDLIQSSVGQEQKVGTSPHLFYVCDTLELASKSTSEVLHSLHVGKVVTFNASSSAMKGSWHVLGIFRRPNAGQWLVLVIASGLPIILKHVREFHVGSIATISDANLEITVEEASQIRDQHLDAKKAIAAQSKASPSPTLKKVKVEVSSITPVSTATHEVKELQQTLDRFNAVCDRLEMTAGVAESLNESMTLALHELKKESRHLCKAERSIVNAALRQVPYPKLQDKDSSIDSN